MGDKVYCLDCKHCMWLPGHGDLSRCGKKIKPDEVIDDPVVGTMLKKGKPIFCSFANANHDCELWEEETSEWVMRRRRNPGLDKAVDCAKFMAPIPILVIIIVILVAIFGG